MKKEQVQRAREILVSTAPDHYCGDELDRYISKLNSDRAVKKEWKKCFDDQEPWNEKISKS